jgi:heptosyltransferase-1
MSKRVLLIKLTSMGDLIHALPALTDAADAIPGIQFDWVADESFADIPGWHPAVNRVIRSAHRRWKKNLRASVLGGQLTDFYRQLNADDYDLILDAQNNLKSAAIATLRRGKSHGLDKNSVREKPAHWAYRYQHSADPSQHAITRLRQLMAQALGYSLPDSEPDYGIDRARLSLPQIELPQHYVFLVHNASWTTKLWPESHWQQLIEYAKESGYSVLLPCGNEAEQQRALRLAANHTNAIALPRLSLSDIGGILNQAQGAVCCDTGLGHMASMLGIPSVNFYGPTDSKLIGAWGLNQQRLIASSDAFPCAPCYKKHCSRDKNIQEMGLCMQAFQPDAVWRELENLILRQSH